MTPDQIERALFRIGGIAERDAAAMADTYERLRELYRSGRNGIWPFILRNLMRPSGQLSPAKVRVAYTKAGTLLSAAVLDDQRVVIDHKAYWAAARSIEEARYLTAILNSWLVLRRIIPMQPRGWRDPATSTTSSGNCPFPNATAERPCTESLPRPLRRPKPSPHRSH